MTLRPTCRSLRLRLPLGGNGSLPRGTEWLAIGRRIFSSPSLISLLRRIPTLRGAASRRSPVCLWCSDACASRQVTRSTVERASAKDAWRHLWAGGGSHRCVGGPAQRIHLFHGVFARRSGQRGGHHRLPHRSQHRLVRRAIAVRRRVRFQPLDGPSGVVRSFPCIEDVGRAGRGALAANG